MKKILTILACSLIIAPAFTQEGPGGISSSSIEMWLDASQLSLTNNDPVSTWADISANGNNAVQTNPTFQPIYLTNQINGLPAVDFDGLSHYMPVNTNIIPGDLTTMMVFSSDFTSNRVPFHTDSVVYMTKGNGVGMASSNPFKDIYVTRTAGTYSVFSGISDFAGSTQTIYSGGSSNSGTQNDQVGRGRTTLGAFWSQGSSSYVLPFPGQIAEIIVFDGILSSAERRIASEYLAGKYDLTSELNLYPYITTHPSDIKGIGTESDGSNTSARGNDSLEISNASSLNNGDYFITGNDGGNYSTSASVPSGVTERWTITWTAGVTGTPGTVSMEFFLGSNDFAATSDYGLLIEEDDGDFTNGGTRVHTTGLSYDAVANSISFTGISLNDGDVFTLAEVDSEVSSVQSGLWKDGTTWSCGCIPAETDIVNIQNTHTVTIDSNAQAFRLNISSAGSLQFSGSDTLAIHEDLDLDGSLSSGNGTISAIGASPAQVFDNQSGSRADLNNLYVNNTNGLSLGSGGWSISDNLQVSSGGLDVSLADSIVLISDASSTSQILESMSNAFTGDFIIQRFIGTRNANFGNLASPLFGGTFQELDDDLFISGANGMDGNATVGGGGIFYSIYQFESRPDTHKAVTQITDPMSSARGYEVWLADNLTTFNATTVDFIGTPASGDVQVAFDFRLSQGWNLIGNPFHSFIDWGSISLPQTSDTYYIFDTDAGSYLLRQPTDPIAPEQGFWVFQPNTGGYFPIFSESDKVNSTLPTFLRRSIKDHFKLSIQSLENNYRHEARVKINENATESFDEFDVTLLPSPIEEAPAIYSMIGKKNRVMENAINSREESYMIPFSIDAGVYGDYIITADNLEGIQDHYSCIYLKDKKSGEAIDLNLESAYEFTASEGEDDRFNLIISNSYTECEKMLSSEGSINQELEESFILRNSFNNWFVDYELEELSQIEIHVYNMNGQEVTNPTYFNASDIGTYKINGLENLNGIYLIQIRSNNQLINKTVKL